MTRLPRPITLDALAGLVPDAEVRGDSSVAVTDVEYDSRRCGPGSLFFCVRGIRHDGHAFVAEAVARGAIAVVAEDPAGAGVPQILVPSVRAAMGPMAAAAFGTPSGAMTLAGVTGTNGKTTTAYMLERCFGALGMTTGLLGTVETHVAGVVEPAGRTTPEAIDLQRSLARMRDAGVGGAAIEVSSHGLALGRVDGCRFACAVFTNLSQDHLDFHGGMEEYFLAKASLFSRSRTAAAVVNVDDAAGLRILQIARSGSLPVTTFGTSGGADWRAEDVVMNPNRSTFVLAGPGVRAPVSVRLAGPFNVTNALAALSAIAACGLDPAAAAGGIAGLSGVPGRFERVDAGQEFTVLVDYAHTSDSVERVLRAARAICSGRLTIVVGCGGDRDRAKRPLMGKAAVMLSDRAILTSDNPRSEEPRSIIAAMEEGARALRRPYEVEPDRRAAIRMALEQAKPGDVVVVAGKGHESGQEIAGRTIPFDDRTVVREELATP